MTPYKTEPEPEPEPDSNIEIGGTIFTSDKAWEDVNDEEKHLLSSSSSSLTTRTHTTSYYTFVRLLLIIIVGVTVFIIVGVTVLWLLAGNTSILQSNGIVKHEGQASASFAIIPALLLVLLLLHRCP